MEKLVWVPVISFCKIFIPSLRVWCPIMSKLAVLAPWSPDFKDNSNVTDFSLVPNFEGPYKGESKEQLVLI
jgi:hypothetical protein